MGVEEEVLTGIAAICSKARSRHALLISRSLRAPSSWAKYEVDAVSLIAPLGSWKRLVGPWKEMRPSVSTFNPSNSLAKSCVSSFSVLILRPALELDSATDAGELPLRASTSAC
ncbi:uncharacterized protein N7482_006063 [Penicillium canariense]|uniref:Uncharacterized protein n=1 Tax=Penicillium canariense TaxID=189055 RepID=A0A9W9I975_9EURO|nr:uncharacterized protein N7482_006063 [Penicillium canariense]KAJ5167282.1 hypothetical protein N7482_006063 [Penicillium canariense]